MIQQQEFEKSSSPQMQHHSQPECPKTPQNQLHQPNQIQHSTDPNPPLPPNIAHQHLNSSQHQPQCSPLMSPNLSYHLARLNPNPNPNPNHQNQLDPIDAEHSSSHDSRQVELLCKRKVASKWKHEEGQKKGRFSLEQQKILSQAVGQFLALHEITFDEFVIILNEKNVINNVLKSLNFFNILSALLPQRSAFSCYRFLRRTFNKDNRKGRWTVEEEGKLLRLVQQHGKDWALIAKQMGRTADNVYDKYRSIGSANANKRKRSNWTLSELIKLLTLVEERSTIKFLDPDIRNELAEETAHNIRDHIDHLKAKNNSQSFKFHNYAIVLKHIRSPIKATPLQIIPWATIANKMQTRSLIDCKNKFMQLLEIVFREHKAKQESIITFIEQQAVSEEGEIDWLQWQREDFTLQEAKNRFFFLKKIIADRSHKTFPVLLAELKAKMKRNGMY